MKNLKKTHTTLWKLFLQLEMLNKVETHLLSLDIWGSTPCLITDNCWSRETLLGFATPGAQAGQPT